MNARRMILLVIVALFLVGTVAEAQPGEGYSVVEGMVSGGGYRLTPLAWQVCGLAAGGGYRLEAAGNAPQSGSGCCCTYLPMMLQNAP